MADKPEKPQPKPQPDAEREKRLAKALRENLRRRKAPPAKPTPDSA
jgi:hypothetical protein